MRRAFDLFLNLCIVLFVISAALDYVGVYDFGFGPR